jgi:FtsX-like permease family/DNA methylase
VSLNLQSSAVTGLRGGLGIRTTCRPYAGDLYGVAVGGAETWTTDGHPWTVKLAPDAAGLWCVYLMQRGPWWRVGKTKLQTTWGFGLKGRMLTEGGEAGWILSLHRSALDAGLAEQVASVRYGIPTTFWHGSARNGRSDADIARLYDALDPDELLRGAQRALADHGRRLAFPLVRHGATRTKLGTRVPFCVRACNLLPGAMTVPVPGRSHEFSWQPVRQIDVQPFTGPVHSMDVERHHHYVADGIVTHNCFYGWREGAAHRFFGPPNVPDTWPVKKVNPAAMVHLTEKPVELARRAMTYSSEPADAVLDLFAGSGSTLIAAEQTGRRAYLVELDPLLGLAAVAPFVAGVGVANIMLMSVLERRSEIGLRRALGATRVHIGLQFLAEALALAVIGGVLGVGAGAAATAVFATTQGWTVVIPPVAVAGGLGAALAIGGVAGLYPAVRAARVPPTEALRTT